MTSMRQLASRSPDGQEPSEEDIRRAVESVVLQGIQVGRHLGDLASANAAPSSENTEQSGEKESDAKRQRR